MRKFFVGLLAAVCMCFALSGTVLAHGSHHSSRHHSTYTQSVSVRKCSVRGCTRNGYHWHNGVRYCGHRYTVSYRHH